MKIVKLTKKYAKQIQHLFVKPKFMGVEHNKTYFVDKNIDNFDKIYFEEFSYTYLSDNKNYISYGVINDNGEINSILGFYESIDDASWYWTQVRTNGNNGDEIKLLLDKTLNYNEKNGRFKFYSMFPLKYQRVYRRLAFSNNAKERYDYFDECYVKIRHQCKFSLHWQILYNRTLLPVDTVVRCTFLKEKYRKEIYHAGKL